MKSNAFTWKRHLNVLSLGFLLLLLSFACNSVDSKLVNKVKTFSPQWSALNDKFVYVERNLNLTKKHFEKDFEQFEGLLDQVPDSLRGKSYHKMLADYEQIIVDRDSMIQVYDSSNALFKSTMKSYNTWEKKAMDGEINYKEGKPELKKYKDIRRSLSEEMGSMKTELESMVEVHNRVLRKLAEYLDIYTNYDIKLR